MTETPDYDLKSPEARLLIAARKASDKGLSLAQIRARLSCDQDAAKSLLDGLRGHGLINSFDASHGGVTRRKWVTTGKGDQVASYLMAAQRHVRDRKEEARPTGGSVDSLKARIVKMLATAGVPLSERVIHNRLGINNRPGVAEALRLLGNEGAIKAHRPGTIVTRGQRTRSNRSWLYSTPKG